MKDLIKKNYRILAYFTKSLASIFESKTRAFWIFCSALIFCLVLLRFFLFDFFLFLSFILLIRKLILNDFRKFPTISGFLFDFYQNGYSRISIFSFIKFLLNLRLFCIFTSYNFNLMDFSNLFFISRCFVLNMISEEVLLKQRNTSFFLAFYVSFFKNPGRNVLQRSLSSAACQHFNLWLQYFQKNHRTNSALEKFVDLHKGYYKILTGNHLLPEKLAGNLNWQDSDFFNPTNIFYYNTPYSDHPLRVSGDLIINRNCIEIKEYNKERLLDASHDNYFFKPFDYKKGEEDKKNSFIAGIIRAVEAKFNYILVLDCYQLKLNASEVQQLKYNFKVFIQSQPELGFTMKNVQLVILQGIESNTVLSTRLSKLISGCSAISHVDNLSQEIANRVDLSTQNKVKLLEDKIPSEDIFLELLASTEHIEKFLETTRHEPEIISPVDLTPTTAYLCKPYSKIEKTFEDSTFSEKIKNGLTNNNGKFKKRQEEEDCLNIITPGYKELALKKKLDRELAFTKELDKHRRSNTSVKTINEIVGEFNLEQDQKKKSW